MLSYVPSDENIITALSRGSIKANKAGKNDKRYYILRKDVVGIERQKKLGVRILGDDVNFNAITGSIYLMNSSKLDSQENCTFTSVDNEGKSITCEKEDLYPLDQKEFQLLVAIPSNNERMLTFKSPLFEKIKRAIEGDFAAIDMESSNGIKSVVGIIRYIGPVKNIKGYLFGLQLMDDVLDKRSICPMSIWTKVKLWRLVESVAREKIIVARPDVLMLEKQFLEVQVQYRSEVIRQPI